MDKKEEFKVFVKEHPQLLKFVKKGEMSWQKFYEMYDMYGTSDEAWKEYLEPVVATAATASTFSLADFLNGFKNINLDSVQTGIGNIQRVLGMVQDLTTKDSTQTKKEEYKPRPLYKHFDD